MDHRDITVAFAPLAVLIALSAVGLQANFLAMLTAATLFLSPGYLALAVLYPEPPSAGQRFDAAGSLPPALAERLVLATGVSIALVAIAASLLAVSPVGLTRSTSLAAAAATLLLYPLALWRRRQFGRLTLVDSPTRGLAGLQGSVRWGELWPLGVLAFASLLILAVLATAPGPGPVTSFAVVGPDGTIASIPEVVEVGSTLNVSLLVSSDRPGSRTFQVSGSVERYTTADAETPVSSRSLSAVQVSVEDGQTLAHPYSITFDAQGHWVVRFHLVGGDVDRLLVVRVQTITAQ